MAMPLPDVYHVTHVWQWCFLFFFVFPVYIVFVDFACIPMCVGGVVACMSLAVLSFLHRFPWFVVGLLHEVGVACVVHYATMPCIASSCVVIP